MNGTILNFYFGVKNEWLFEYNCGFFYFVVKRQMSIWENCKISYFAVKKKESARMGTRITPNPG